MHPFDETSSLFTIHYSLKGGYEIFRWCFFRAAMGDQRSPTAISYFLRFYRHSLFRTPSGGTIFLCLKKDRGERHASSSQAPHPSFCLSGQKLSRSATPPLPTKPTSLGFGGAPVGGPLNPLGNVLGHFDVLCAYVFAMVRLTRLSRLRCREANTLGVRCRLSPCLCVLHCPEK